LGFSVSIHEFSPGKANLLAGLGGGGAVGEGLVLSGHTDTVPFDEGEWSVDPFAGVEREGRLYGLGSCDMKAFFALAIEAARSFDPRSFRRPLTLLATADEESSMAGAKYLLQQGLKPGRYAVIGEPTGLRPIRMHKGVMMESIRVHGHAGHSSDPSLGANAIEGMHHVLAELLAWRRELQARYRNPLFKVDTPTLNLGSIHGGDNPNRICAHCEVHIDIRPLPGMSLEALRQAMGERLHDALAAYPTLRVETYPLFDGLPPFETPAESLMVRTCEELTGTLAGAVAFGTEAPFLSRLGMETVVLGPGDVAQAHQPDEYLDLAQIAPTIEVLKGLIRRFCLE
ncbi:MAG: acetylornithine deacetylase, partial [Methylococcaceae bacterium]|nr:acetylornithine deacetylase [Methylococcaceae bacterium]